LIARPIANRNRRVNPLACSDKPYSMREDTRTSEARNQKPEARTVLASGLPASVP
jgi:hypothetical protein